MGNSARIEVSTTCVHDERQSVPLRHFWSTHLGKPHTFLAKCKAVAAIVRAAFVWLSVSLLFHSIFYDSQRSACTESKNR